MTTNQVGPAGAATPSYGATAGGQPFRVCGSGEPCSAPPIESWGTRPAGDDYRTSWDAVAKQLGTQNPVAVRAEIERQLYGQHGLDGYRVPTSASTSPQRASSDSADKEGIGAFVDGLVKGDFGDNKSWSATAGQVIGGFIPIVGQIGDARDTAAAIGGVWRGEDGAWGNLAMAGVAWVPGVGDLAKGALKGGRKIADAGGEVATQAIRHSDEAAQAARKQIVLDGGRKGEWPKELNARNLAPNADYFVNGHLFKTDALGRVNHVEGKLDLKTAERNGYQQQVAGREDRLPDDQGGHLIASIFNGPGDRLNLVPMNGNFNMGAWRDMERTLETALKDGKSVEVKMDVIYKGEGGRPDKFIVEYKINGVKTDATFTNQPGG